jgi:hypothetical protein
MAEYRSSGSGKANNSTDSAFRVTDKGPRSILPSRLRAESFPPLPTPGPAAPARSGQRVLFRSTAEANQSKDRPTSVQKIRRPHNFPQNTYKGRRMMLAIRAKSLSKVKSVALCQPECTPGARNDAVLLNGWLIRLAESTKRWGTSAQRRGMVPSLPRPRKEGTILVRGFGSADQSSRVAASASSASWLIT